MCVSFSYFDIYIKTRTNLVLVLRINFQRSVKLKNIQSFSQLTVLLFKIKHRKLSSLWRPFQYDISLLGRWELWKCSIYAKVILKWSLAKNEKSEFDSSHSLFCFVKRNIFGNFCCETFFYRELWLTPNCPSFCKNIRQWLIPVANPFD